MAVCLCVRMVWFKNSGDQKIFCVLDAVKLLFEALLELNRFRSGKEWP